MRAIGLVLLAMLAPTAALGAQRTPGPAGAAIAVTAEVVATALPPRPRALVAPRDGGALVLSMEHRPGSEAFAVWLEVQGMPASGSPVVVRDARGRRWELRADGGLVRVDATDADGGAAPQVDYRIEDASADATREVSRLPVVLQVVVARTDQ